MHKLEGLRFLQKHFPDICVDCVFIGRNELPDRRLLKNRPGRLFRVRSGRSRGSELSLPRRTCRSVAEVENFVVRTRAEDSNLEFVVHRVTAAYFAPMLVGTLALFERPSPVMLIQIQRASTALVNQMDVGVRARDWPVAAIYSFPHFGQRPEIVTVDPTLQAQSISQEIHLLWNLGREIDSLKQAAGSSYETVTLFNIYPSGDVMIDDHRGVESFA